MKKRKPKKTPRPPLTLSMSAIARVMGLDRSTVAKRLDAIRAVAIGKSTRAVYTLADALAALEKAQHVKPRQALALAGVASGEVEKPAKMTRLERIAADLAPAGDYIEALADIVRLIARAVTVVPSKGDVPGGEVRRVRELCDSLAAVVSSKLLQKAPQHV